MAYGALFSTKLIVDGRFEQAIDATAREISADPDDPEPYFNRGRALAGLAQTGLGDWSAAVESYQQALQRDASASAVEPDEIDDELFFALRLWAVAERDSHEDVARALAVLDRYASLCPAGRHIADLDTWRDHLRGVEQVWVRERV